MGGWGRASASPQLSEFWGLGSTSTPGTRYTDFKRALVHFLGVDPAHEFAELAADDFDAVVLVLLFHRFEVLAAAILASPIHSLANVPSCTSLRMRFISASWFRR